MTAPAINTLEYLRRALSEDQNSAVVTQNADGTLSIRVDIGPGAAEVQLAPLQGPAGPPGLPQFPLMRMPDVYTDPKDLPFDLTNTNADIGKFWLITQSDANGVINSAAYIWFGTEYRMLPFGVQGPPGPYGVIQPYVTLTGPGNTSDMTWMDGKEVTSEAPPNAGTPADPYRVNFNLSVPPGPAGESCPLFDMPDVSHDVPPLTGQFLTYTGKTVVHDSQTLPVWEPNNAGDFVPQPYIVPASAFRGYANIDFSTPVSILTFPMPPLPFAWKPLVFGQIEMQGHSNVWYDSLPSQIGVAVILGDPDPDVGTLVGRGFGNAPRGVVTVMPHCSHVDNLYGAFPNTAMTPWNTVGAVPANHTGTEGNINVFLVNDSGVFRNAKVRVRFTFNVNGSNLFVLACPMTNQSALTPPLYGALSTRLKLTGNVGS